MIALNESYKTSLLQVNNLNDENPSWSTAPADTSINENSAVGTSVFTVQATDDSSAVTYSLISVTGGENLS